MRSRLPRLLTALSACALIGASCAADDNGVDAIESNGSTAVDAPPHDDTTPVPAVDGRVAPAFPTDIADVADIRTVLAPLGFPAGWPLPDGLAASDVVGVRVSQSTGSDGTTTSSLTAWRQAATDDPAALALEWYDRASEVLGVDTAISNGTITGNSLQGFLVSGGLDSDPNGSLAVTVIRPEGDATAPVIVEIEHEIDVAGAPADMQLPPALLAALPDLTGCVPELISAEYQAYTQPNDFARDPSYATIFDGNCPTRASYDAAVAWSATAGVQAFQHGDHVEVTDAPGPNGTRLHVYAGVTTDGTTSIRTDTEAPITTG